MLKDLTLTLKGKLGKIKRRTQKVSKVIEKKRSPIYYTQAKKIAFFGTKRLLRQKKEKSGLWDLCSKDEFFNWVGNSVLSQRAEILCLKATV